MNTPSMLRDEEIEREQARLKSLKEKDNIFEDFPLRERRHYNDHPAKNSVLGADLTNTGKEVESLEHISRVQLAHKSTVPIGLAKGSHEHQQGGEGMEDTSSTGVPMDPSLWTSSYQAQCNAASGVGNFEDVGQIKKHRGKKKMMPPYCVATRTGILAHQAPVLGAGGESLAADLGSRTLEVGHIPGYSGHVPRSGVVAVEARDVDKNMIEANYRTNLKGYSGHTK
mmetsp:Transcript_25423/g.35027  ORF Transcript_25423/g.35027 Transcript_25423/m.35027 type:complete len:226 (+) Transcript_25423:145-822(+)|eukprot:CAMPEP_0196574722 /NCGR_PEP_ID=MMETSP1081-20130531/4376_1 /TAXON_ID=36882 /ORGANISM="Pyramimonas amylifera, Strain CCMP720" /LENGTH=225 /DNA_ID=CAMNT_0041892825 /DNA_START=143 /DNA_END=820 /DNA_ORIENTATION=-